MILYKECKDFILSKLITKIEYHESKCIANSGPDIDNISHVKFLQ